MAQRGRTGSRAKAGLGSSKSDTEVRTAVPFPAESLSFLHLRPPWPELMKISSLSQLSSISGSFLMMKEAERAFQGEKCASRHCRPPGPTPAATSPHCLLDRSPSGSKTRGSSVQPVGWSGSVTRSWRAQGFHDLLCSPGHNSKKKKKETFHLNSFNEYCLSNCLILETRRTKPDVRRGVAVSSPDRGSRSQLGVCPSTSFSKRSLWKKEPRR